MSKFVKRGETGETKGALDENSQIDCLECKLTTVAMCCVLNGYLLYHRRRLTIKKQITNAQKVVFPSLIAGITYVGFSRMFKWPPFNNKKSTDVTRSS